MNIKMTVLFGLLVITTSASSLYSMTIYNHLTRPLPVNVQFSSLPSGGQYVPDKPENKVSATIAQGEFYTFNKPYGASNSITAVTVDNNTQIPWSHAAKQGDPNHGYFIEQTNNQEGMCLKSNSGDIKNNHC